MNHPLTQLVARYGHERGHYLYGEWCLLQTLGFEAFRSRHTPAQLDALAAALAPLSLWPSGPEAGPDEGPPPEDGAQAAHPAQDQIAALLEELAGVPLRLGCGTDLFVAICAWAAAGGVATGAWFEPSRSALTETLGFVPPPLAVGLDPALPAHGYRLTIWREAVLEGEAFPGLDLVIGRADERPPALPYPWTPDPAGPGWVAWMPVGPASEPPPDLPRVHWLVAVDRHLTAALPAHADRLVTPAVVQGLLTEAERAGYDHELERYVSIPELRLVFKALLRQGLPLRPIAPMLEAMLRAILAELAGRPLTPPELERLGRQLPVFPTAKLVGLVRAASGLPAEPPTGGAALLMRMARALPPGPLPPERPADAAATDEAAWRALAAQATATRPLAMRLAAALRLADVLRGLPPWSTFHHAAPPAATDVDDAVRVAALRLANEAGPYIAGWEAWRAWGRAASLAMRAGAALDGGAPWPPGAHEPGLPEWAWALDRPGKLLAAWAEEGGADASTDDITEPGG